MERRLRIAIVSSFDENCGIAAYTRALVRQLSSHADVEVFDLDQFLLRRPSRRTQRAADRHIHDIALKISQFDSVNIQLEYGTLGRSPARVLKRFKTLAKAARVLSVTLHTVLVSERIPWGEMQRAILQREFSAAGARLGEALRSTFLSWGIYSFLRRLQRRIPVRVIVHRPRDKKLLQIEYGLKEVFHHPLTFVDSERALKIRSGATRAAFPMMQKLPSDAKLFGTFGFISPYKGFDVAVRALKLLPRDHHLLIFGNIHPQAVKRHQRIDPYIKQLLDEGLIGQTILDGITGSKFDKNLILNADMKELFALSPQSLASRIHFMGTLSDDDFLVAMAICDAVLLPYIEVGQASSGPISMAIDMGCRVIASRTNAFLDIARLYPNAIEFFDIGNHAELASRIASPRAFIPTTDRLRYSAETNAALYVHANTPSVWPVSLDGG